MDSRDIVTGTFGPGLRAFVFAGLAGLFFLALTCALGYVLISEGDYPPALIMGALLFFGGAAYCLYYCVNFRSSIVEMDQDGLRNSNGSKLRWDEIASITPGVFHERLSLKDSTGSRCVSLEYGIKDFETVATQVALLASGIRKSFESFSHAGKDPIPPPYAIREEMLVMNAGTEKILCDMRKVKSVRLTAIKRGNAKSLALAVEEEAGARKLLTSAGSDETVFALLYGVDNYLLRREASPE